MDEDGSFLLVHFVDPFVGLVEVLDDLLLREVLNRVRLVNVLGVANKGGVEVGSANAYRSDAKLLQKGQRRGRVLVAQVEALLDHVDLGKFMGAGLLELLH